MTEVLTPVEIGALLRIAKVAPAQTSPLARLQSAAADRGTVVALAAKGACSADGAIAPEWQAMLATLADPLIQATLHIEGVGGGQYFAGTGGISGLAQTPDGNYQLFGGWSVDAIVVEIDDLMPWRSVPDAPPLRQDFSLEEFTVLAALADAHREELLQACIDRRPAGRGAVTRDLAAHHVSAGTSRIDLRWLVSILAQFAAPQQVPNADHLDRGAQALIARNLARTGDGALALSPDLQTFCDGFANITPFLALAVHAPWADREVALFTRGLQHFWGIEYLSGQAVPRVRVSRMGGRAMEASLRQFLAPLAAHATPAPAAAPAATRASVPQARVEHAATPAPRPTVPAVPTAAAPAPPAPAPVKCPKCGKVAKPGARFCAACGTSFAAGVQN